MTTVVASARESSPGFKARGLRVYLGLTQRELAKLAGVSKKEVGLFEHNQPLPLDFKRKLLKELWARRAGKC